METAILKMTTRSQSILFQTTDWSVIPHTEHRGDSGIALWKTMQYDGLRIRVVEYSSNYSADHWCSVGHILYCLDGEMTTELSDGRVFKLVAGMSYQVTDGASAHRSKSMTGAKVLIVDGEFLRPPKHYNPWKM